jgi:hypothetical protein
MARTVEVRSTKWTRGCLSIPRAPHCSVIGMQNDFVKEGGTLVIPDAEATLPRIAQLLELARQARMKVVSARTRMTRATSNGRSGESTSGAARGAGRSSTGSPRARTSS